MKHVLAKFLAILTCISPLKAYSFLQIRQLINQLVATALKQYLDDGAVIPMNLLLGLFLIFAKDNVDKSALSTTSPDAFHGTSISAFQQPTTGIAS